MQFFPSLEPSGAQDFRASGFPETSGGRAEQGFLDVLSTHMERPASAVESATGLDRTEAREPHAHVVEERREESVSPDADSSSDGAHPGGLSGPEEAPAAPQGAAEAAPSPVAEKAAAGEKGAAESGSGKETRHGDSARSTEAEHPAAEKAESAGSGKESKSGEAARKAGEKASTTDQKADATGTDDAQSLEQMLGTVLALAAETEKENESGAALNAGNGTQIRQEIKTRIAALRELVEQFQAAAPEERSALAVSLGEQLKGLKAALVSAAAEKNAAVNSGAKRTASGQAAQSGSGASAALGAALQKIDEVAPRVAAESSRGKTDGPAATGSRQGEAAKTGQPVARGADSSKKQEKTADETVQSAVDVGATEETGADEITSRPVADRFLKDADKSGHAKNDGTATKAAAEEEGGRPSTREEAEAKAVSQAGGTPAAERDGDAKAGAMDKTREAKTAHAMSAVRDGLATREGSAGTRHEAAVQADAGQQEASSAETATHVREGGEQRKRNDAGQGFFSSQGGEKKAGKAAAAATAKSGSENQNVTQTVVETIQSQPSQTGTSSTVRSTEVYRQVENGAFKNLGQGVKQLVIRLDPAELGQVSVILQVKGKEVQAVLKTSSHETTHALNEQMSQLRTQLESQGLKVTRLEVQTQLADSQSQSQWQGAEQHNRYQENRELAMSANRWRAMGRMDADMVRDVQNVIQREKNSQGGVDIFA